MSRSATAPKVDTPARESRLAGFQISERAYTEFAEQCARDERSVSATVRWLISRYMAETQQAA